MVKLFITCILCLLFIDSYTYAQIGINTSNVNPSISLTFEENTTNGLVLPINQNLPSTPATGTLTVDGNDGKLKLYNGSQWQDYSNPGNLNTSTGGLYDISYNTSSEVETAVIIGDENSSKKGVLVIDSANPMVLPKIENPHLNVVNPYPGMVCYDTTSKSIAYFNGEEWNFIHKID